MEANPAFHEPRPNQFIATDFSIIDPDTQPTEVFSSCRSVYVCLYHGCVCVWGGGGGGGAQNIMRILAV